jgi:hypothetical protein
MYGNYEITKHDKNIFMLTAIFKIVACLED